MMIRAYLTSDAEAIANIYRDAVIGVGATAYDAQQIAIWSSYPEDIESFRMLLKSGLTLVAVEDARLVAFGQLNPSDHIAFLYTVSDCARRGYATKIYQALETHAIEQGIKHLDTAASRISKYFFIKMGFRVLETEFVERKGVQFERFKMKKILF